MNREHFFVSRTGAVFSIYKLGDYWYLLGLLDKKIRPMQSSDKYWALRKYIKNQLGLIKL